MLKFVTYLNEISMKNLVKFKGSVIVVCLFLTSCACNSWVESRTDWCGGITDSGYGFMIPCNSQNVEITECRRLFGETTRSEKVLPD